MSVHTTEESKQIDILTEENAVSPIDMKNEDKFRILNTKIDISHLSEIQTASRTFRCDVAVTMTWTMTDKQKSKVLQLQNNDDELNEYLSTIKYPKLVPVNGVDVETQFLTDPEVEISLVKDENNKLQFVCDQWLRGTWSMSRAEDELNDFPFDYIKLPIEIWTANAHKDRFRIFIPQKNDFTQNTVIIEASESQEFDCYMAEIATFIEADPSREHYAGFVSINIYAKRKWRYYFNQVVIFVFLLSCMVLPAYGIDVRDIGDRLAHFVTLLLAQTALLYFVGATLPKLSYFSILDEYLIYNFILTLICGFQTAIMSLIDNDDEAEQIDAYCFYAICAVFVGLNAFYGIHSCRTAKKNNKTQFIPSLFELNKQYFVKENAEAAAVKSRWQEGICVYHQHDWNNLGEYRDWRKQNDEFDPDCFIMMDKIIVLFGEEGIYDAADFKQQNNDLRISNENYEQIK